MHWYPAVVAFAIIFPAELPDKSLFASLVLGTRFKPWPVWSGVSAAFVVHTILAVAAGRVLFLVPPKVLSVIVTVLFAVGAAILLLGKESDELLEGEQEAGEAIGSATRETTSFRRAFATSFAVVFIGEWGDVTQIAMVNLSARYHDPVSVGIGSGIALVTVTALAVVAGRKIVKVVPVALVRRVAGVILAGFAVVATVAVFR